MLPNMEERPKLKSMMKNNMAHTWEPGISITASVNTIKAKPVPEALWGKTIKETRDSKDERYGPRTKVCSFGIICCVFEVKGT